MVEAGIHANNDPIRVINLAGVDAKSRNAADLRIQVKSQPGAS